MKLESGRQFSYLPLFQEYASSLSDEMPEPAWSDSVGWSTGLRQTADLVEPDVIVATGFEPLLADLTEAASDTPGDSQLDGSIGSACEGFCEMIRILDEVRQEPVFALLPGPATICIRQFDQAWLDTLESDEFVALDALHESSHCLTDLIRAVGGSISGVIIDDPLLERARREGLSLGDVVVETGAVFNVAGHHDIPIYGRFPEAAPDLVSSFEDGYQAVIFDQLSLDDLDRIDGRHRQIGGSFEQMVWDCLDDEFEMTVVEYIESLPEGYLLMPEIPPSVPPERVRRFRELLDGQELTPQ